MCEANAYLIDPPNPEKLIMEAVDTVEQEADGIKLISIFGEQKFIHGEIHALSLVNHKIYIRPTEKIKYPNYPP